MKLRPSEIETWRANDWNRVQKLRSSVVFITFCSTWSTDTYTPNPSTSHFKDDKLLQALIMSNGVRGELTKIYSLFHTNLCQLVCHKYTQKKRVSLTGGMNYDILKFCHSFTTQNWNRKILWWKNVFFVRILEILLHNNSPTHHWPMMYILL